MAHFVISDQFQIVAGWKLNIRLGIRFFSGENREKLTLCVGNSESRQSIESLFLDRSDMIYFATESTAG